MNPVMSVEEARELLGDECKSMNDEEIEQLISDLDVLARYALKLAREKLHGDRANSKTENSDPI